MPNVVIGVLGTKLDSGTDEHRWTRWRPSVGLCQHEELLIDRFDLLYETRDKALAEHVRDDLRQVSPETSVQLHPLTLADAWDFDEVFDQLLQFASNYRFRPEEETYWLHITTGTHVEQICMFLLAESRHIPAQLLQTAPPRRAHCGAGRYRIIDLDLSKYDALANRFIEQHHDSVSFLKSGIETRNAAFNRLIDQIEVVAGVSRQPLLLTGPTGAGKSQLARKIYELKRRRGRISGPLVEVNCATLRGDHAMSALFGHLAGAYTGATAARAGLLRTADQGLLFLDEIGELGLDEQAMLLRGIEEKRFLPVGADSEVSSDFQLIAGTNRDLKSAVTAGRFRDDLLARINLWTFCLPGLKDRREDIEPNLNFELQRFESDSGRRVTLNKEAREQFLLFAQSDEAVWTGNFRDLNASVTRMATLASGGRITSEQVAQEIQRLRRDWQQADQPPRDPGDAILRSLLQPDDYSQLDLFDRAQLASVIGVCLDAPTISEAGRRLFAVSRQSKKQPNDADRLRKYLARFGLSWAELKQADAKPDAHRRCD